MLKKSIEDGKDIFISLLHYRNTPLKYVNHSPSQLLMSRRCKTQVPVCAELLQPTLCKNVKEGLCKRQAHNESYFNKTATDLKELQPNDNVTVFNHINQRWESGKIIDLDKTPRSYKVIDKSGIGS